MVYETVARLNYVPEEWLLISLKKQTFVVVKEMLYELQVKPLLI